MLRGVRRILAATRLLAETALDGLASTRRTPLRRPSDSAAGGDLPDALRQSEAGKADGRLRGRLRAANVLMRMTSALGIAWNCRRRAFTVYRALVREGVPARLCFGIRRARPGESHGGSYVGHVWASRGTQQDAEARRADFPLMIAYPVGGEAAGWRRG